MLNTENVLPGFETLNDIIQDTLHDLHHYLPAQAPLKDFVHHNTLHAFQDLKFFDAVRKSNRLFGYKTLLSLSEYRRLFVYGRISETQLLKAISDRTNAEQDKIDLHRHLKADLKPSLIPRVGRLRSLWKSEYHLDLDALIHPILFRTLCNFLDQGIALKPFPYPDLPFIEAVRKLEENGWVSMFEDTRTRKEFVKGVRPLEDLLQELLGSKKLIKPYLFDQQFAHQGWSGMVATVERQPETLLDKRSITLYDLVYLESFLELDRLRHFRKDKWKPLNGHISLEMDYFAELNGKDEYQVILEDFHRAFEWSFYDQVARALQLNQYRPEPIFNLRFQAFFCIDDRECSLRRYLEELEPDCETYGTPGFFGLDAFFRPSGGKFVTKICPVPVMPKHLIVEQGAPRKIKKDLHLSGLSYSGPVAWIASQVLGFLAAFKLFVQFFRPGGHAAGADSFQHMDAESGLQIRYEGKKDEETGLLLGYTYEEMALRVENLLRTTGVVKQFAPLVYLIGHGASSVNNPHFAAYDCGACSGRAGSVNARAISQMANIPEVRAILKEKGIDIPEYTCFVGALHDTTRDEFMFFEEDIKDTTKFDDHQLVVDLFAAAAIRNAKERSRRFVNTDTAQDAKEVFRKVRARAFSLFEPRPELNHATNAVCIVGRRALSRGVFLDRRSFLNSYDAYTDPEGRYLDPILNAATPVCGGINLEYFFSRTDVMNLGANTKLPHNVMGLIGVANGVEGDLRPGLPSQMIEVHDPVRLLMVVEHDPEVVMNALLRNPSTKQWYDHEWIHLLVIEPRSRNLFIYQNGMFNSYQPEVQQIPVTFDVKSIIESTLENIPVMLIKERKEL